MCKINDILTSKSVYKHQNDESGEINVQKSQNRSHKHQNTTSSQNGNKMADTCVKQTSVQSALGCVHESACVLIQIKQYYAIYRKIAPQV